MRVVIRPGASNGHAPLGKLDRMIRSQRLSRPSFCHCWVREEMPPGEVEEEYWVNDCAVKIISLGEGRRVYHIAPEEYRLPQREMVLLRDLIGRIPEHPPEHLGVDSEALREHVLSLSRSFLEGGGDREESTDGVDRVRQLAEIAARHTVGLGMFELLLRDERVEDVYIDSPPGRSPAHVTIHRGPDSLLKCTTNLTVTEEEVGGLISRLKQVSGRPFSEGYPTMETEVPGFDSRATLIGPPLSPSGVAVAIRRRNSRLWTLAKLLHNGTMDALTSALISLLIEGNSTVLIAGPRGVGKSSLLSAAMFEFPIDQRILTIEDTRELPVFQMQGLGYDIQSLLVQERIDGNREREMDEALRVTLRMGETAIVLGEVRGREARTLYQGMRTGRAGSAVMGTIHGSSAESVFKRVVHDIGISREAFSATDVIISLGIHRPMGTGKRSRKVVQVAEYRGDGSFKDLISFDGQAWTPDLEGSRVLGEIARSWNVGLDEVLRDLRKRAALKGALVRAEKIPGRLEPEWTIRSNGLYRSRGGEHGEELIHQVLGDPMESG
ncbi:MAG: ATPase, T2SS/T4P/T4SS family [Methanomassiliicoccales archaeon]